MSARVLAPMMSEPSRRPARAAATLLADVGGVGSVGGGGGDAAVARVRRDLFGPVDRAATQRFLEAELAAQSARDADRWGFDFDAEAPRRSGPGTARYAWQRVDAQHAVPETYALRRLAFLQRASAEQPAQPAQPAQRDVGKTVEGVVVVAVDAAKKAEAKPLQITDFMKKSKPRKRRPTADADACVATATSGKATPPAAKVARPAPS